MFEPFQNFIKRAAKHYGVATEIEAIKICNDFRGLIPRLFTEKPSPEIHIGPAYFKNHTLVVSVENSAWAQEVITRKVKIIDEMNAKAGRKVIKNLRTQLRQEASAKVGS